MEAPSTPKSQNQVIKLVQQPTPPPTDPATRTYEAFPDQERSQGQSERTWDQQEETAPRFEGRVERPGAEGQSQSDITRWLYDSASPEQRQRRFTALLHSFWPSNDEFNGARHPFYDPKEDGPYDEFIKYQMWDGHCPFDDDDYDPLTDPTRSTEVWQPKIGDEGIEDEKDLSMVLKGRREHRARSERFRRCRYQVIEAQLRAGVKLADVDMTQVLVGEINLDDLSDSDSSSGDEQGIEVSKPIAKAPAALANPQPQEGSGALFTTINGVKVFGAQQPKRGVSRSCGGRAGKKAGGRRPNKRKRGSSRAGIDRTYKDDGGPEDDDRPTRKKRKSAKGATKDVGADSPPWKAQTRAAARRAARPPGMDGSYEYDGDDSKGADYGTDSSSNSTDTISGPNEEQEISKSNEQ